MAGRSLLQVPTSLLLLFFLSAGCAGVGMRQEVRTRHGHGPPPHAPAHGYRHKTSQGVDIVYDSKLAVYVVVGVKDHYYLDGRYYRRVQDRWEVSVRLNDSWQLVSKEALPAGLKSKFKGKANRKKKG